MQYYVIRDADTGMYWRGKGVNKWGQYYNQCSIFRIRGQAESSLREIQIRDAKNAEIVPITIHEEAFWVKPSLGSQEFCSNCKLTAKMIFGILPPFCPHCGSPMKEEVYKLYEEDTK